MWCADRCAITTPVFISSAAAVIRELSIFKYGLKFYYSRQVISKFYSIKRWQSCTTHGLNVDSGLAEKGPESPPH